jgi:hypothetical protein
VRGLKGASWPSALTFIRLSEGSVFYSYLTTPVGYPSPPEANRGQSEEISDAMKLDESLIIKQWPVVAGMARSQYLGPERNVIVIDILALSEADLAKPVKRALNSAEKDFLCTIRQGAPAMLDQQRSARLGFETRLAERWGEALDLFETILVISQESGSNFNRKYQTQAVTENDLVFVVLIQLHARICLTASEVLALLRSGHAAGAHSRWRTLHEIAAVAYFVKRFGQDVAERYLEGV